MTARRLYEDRGPLAFRHRSALKLLTTGNAKTPKGEALGYFSAILYLAPHTSGGGPTVCPYSTQACRDMCPSGSGVGGLPIQTLARKNRVALMHADPTTFLRNLVLDIDKLAQLAEEEGLVPVVRLNGTSDLMWERTHPIIFASFPAVRFMDYTKVPLEFRHKAPANYHLTFSHGGRDDAARSVEYLGDGRSVAAVVDEAQKAALLERGYLGRFRYVDGDEHDLRFLDPPGSIVLLKPKGRVITSLLRPALDEELGAALYG